MAVFFPIKRYLDEDGVYEVMTLEKLHRLAEERSATIYKSTSKRKRENSDEAYEKKPDKSGEPRNDKSKKKRRLSDEEKVKQSKEKHLFNEEENPSSNEKHIPNEVADSFVKEEKTKKKECSSNEVDSSSFAEDKDSKDEKKCDDDNNSNGDIDKEDPLPLLTHTPKLKKTQSVHYQLPDWVTQYSHIEEDINSHSQPIENFSLHSTLAKNLTKMSVTHFFPVQCKVIPEIMKCSQGPLLTTKCGQPPPDLCVCAPTGCGKTLSYVVPIVSALMTLNTKYLRALIVVPSKDLALQVHNVFKSVSKGTGVRIGVVCSLHSLSIEQESIVSTMGSEIDVLVATPGRLVTHLKETPLFSLSYLRYLIIDEADRIFEEEYQSWLNYVIKATAISPPLTSDLSSLLAGSSLPMLLPNLCKLLMRYDICSDRSLSVSDTQRQPLQKLLFSATLSLNPERLSLLQLHRPRLFTVAPATKEELGEAILPSTLREHTIHCDLDYKPLGLLHLILTYGHRKMLCFTHSCESAHRLALLLQQYNAPVAEISSKSSLGARNEAIRKLNSGKIKVLISSDGMARGIDIVGIDCVINYDAPSHFRSYLHRVGRTARAGNEGIAYTFLTPDEVNKFKRMMKAAGRKKTRNSKITEEDIKPYLESYPVALKSVSELVN